MCFEGDESVFRKHVIRLCECATETETPLEINLLGLRDHRHYPDKRFFKIAAEMGNKAVLGLDAHDPDCIDHSDCVACGRKFAEECGIEILEDIPYHSPIH